MTEGSKQEAESSWQQFMEAAGSSSDCCVHSSILCSTLTLGARSIRAGVQTRHLSIGNKKRGWGSVNMAHSDHMQNGHAPRQPPTALCIRLQPAQHSATLGNPLQPSRSFCNPLQPSTTPYNPLQPSKNLYNHLGPSSIPSTSHQMIKHRCLAILYNPLQPSTTICNPLQPSTTLNHPLQPSTTLNHPLQPSATLNHPLQPSTTLNHPQPPSATLYNPPSTTLNNPIQRPAVLYNPLQPSTTIYDPPQSSQPPTK